MNRLLKTLTGAMVGLFVTVSCDVTNQKPGQSLPSEDVLTTEQGANAALTGAYDAYQDAITYDYRFTELAGDYADHTGSYPSWANVDQHNMLPPNAEARDFWINSYDLINIANNLIANIPGIEQEGFSDAEKNRIVAEAQVLRALSYHSLVRFFGGVPLITSPTTTLSEEDNVAKSAVSAVYDQIIADLTSAESALGASGSANATRITGYTAKALLARVNLYAGNYSAAETYATEIINSGEFALGDYAGLFGDAVGGSEAIFVLSFTTEDSNNLSFFARPNGAGGRYEYGPSGTYTAAFNAEDERVSANILNIAGNSILGKYHTIEGNDDVIIVRLAEMYLIRAEARGMQDDYAGAAEDLNTIQRRAYGDDITVAQTYDYAAADVNSDETLLDAVLYQRGIELAQEGHRWHDLNRTGRSTAVFGIDEEMTLWPIPQRDINSNPNLEQNPGY